MLLFKKGALGQSIGIAGFGFHFLIQSIMIKSCWKCIDDKCRKENIGGKPLRDFNSNEIDKQMHFAYATRPKLKWLIFIIFE